MSLHLSVAKLPLKQSDSQINLTPKRLRPGIPGIFDRNTRIPGYFSSENRNSTEMDASSQMDASERGDSGLSGPVPNFKIGSRVWKLGESIHSVGLAAVEEKKWLKLFVNNMRQQGSKESLWALLLGTNIV